MNNYFNSFKTLFHLTNFVFIILYIYPGSLLGWIIFNDVSKQPQITINFIVSSNHVYAFFLLTAVGLLAYKNKNLKTLFLYLFVISILLELLHNVIPNRSFEFSDLFGNFVGVLIVYIFFIVYRYFKKKKI
jgi:VanZ family protein